MKDGLRARIPKTILGHNIWQLRGWWNWSRSRLAQESHVPTSLIRQIEYGNGDPRLSQLRALANVLKVKEGDLLKPGAPLVSVSDLSSKRIRRKFRQGSPNDCWIWFGAKREIYGIYQMDGDRCYPHRLVYAMEKPLMMNWDLDHTCVNPLCVNPAHLEVVTRGTNLHWRDRRSSRKTKKTEAN